MSGEKEHVLRDAIWRAAQEDGIELFDTACEAYAAEIRAEEREKAKALREALEDLIGVLEPCATPARRDPAFHDIVKALGLQIGFGAMMQTASAAWREELGGQAGGEHVSGPCFAVLSASVNRAKASLSEVSPSPVPSGQAGESEG